MVTRRVGGTVPVSQIPAYKGVTYNPASATPYVAPKTTYIAPATTSNNAALVAAVQAQPAPQYSAPVQSAEAMNQAAANTIRDAQAAYTPAPYSVNLPSIDWSFNPTSDQQAGWQNQASATAGQEIDPQLLAIKTALEQYMTQGQNTRNELNPRYTNQSLSIANIIQNSVKQDAINNAIKRGADTSGWLPSALMDAGKLETEQRSGIEANRNTDLNALAALEAQQTQAAGEQNVGLEKLRGQRITSALADLQNQAQSQDLATKQNQWNSALGGEQLRASSYGDNASNQLAQYQTQQSVAMSNADRALQASIAENNQANTQWEQANTESQQAYGQQQDALQASLNAVRTGSSGGGSGTGTTYIDTPYGKLTVSQASALGYIKPGQYADNGTTSTNTLEQRVQDAINQKILDSLNVGNTTNANNYATTNPGNIAVGHN